MQKIRKTKTEERRCQRETIEKGKTAPVEESRKTYCIEFVVSYITLQLGRHLFIGVFVSQTSNKEESLGPFSRDDFLGLILNLVACCSAFLTASLSFSRCSLLTPFLFLPPSSHRHLPYIHPIDTHTYTHIHTNTHTILFYIPQRTVLPRLLTLLDRTQSESESLGNTYVWSRFATKFARRAPMHHHHSGFVAPAQRLCLRRWPQPRKQQQNTDTSRESHLRSRNFWLRYR